jgi:hypothetical protein
MSSNIEAVRPLFLGRRKGGGGAEEGRRKGGGGAEEGRRSVVELTSLIISIRHNYIQ